MDHMLEFHKPPLEQHYDEQQAPERIPDPQTLVQDREAFLRQQRGQGNESGANPSQ